MSDTKKVAKSVKKSLSSEGPSTVASLKKFGSKLWERIKGKNPEWRKKLDKKKGD